MILRLPKIEKVLFEGRSSRHRSHLSAAGRYRHLRRTLMITMLLITLIPLAGTSLLSFFQYRQLLRQEALNNLQWHGESTSRSLEVFLDKLKNGLVVTANSYPVGILTEQKHLDRILAELKSDHRGLVDLSLINPDGIQVAYAGPYNLRGKNYRDSPWYNRALARKVFVSDVFTGYRNVPHFVIAVTKQEQGQDGYWVLRASIDTRTLEDFLGSAWAEQIDELFLINQENVLQTSSWYWGRIGEKFPVTFNPIRKGFSVVDERTDNGNKVMRAAGVVAGTPWTLVLEQRDYAGQKSWSSFRDQLVAIFVITVLAAGVLIINISNALAAKIRDADEARELFLKDQEHTNKLASIGRLAAGVAHEINNPLAIINEKAGLLKDILKLTKDFPHQDKFVTQLSALENAVERARTITHRLLGFARRMEVSLKSVQLNEIIREVLGFLEKEALYRNIKLDLQLLRDLPAIKSDPGQLQQVLLNVINNAIDAIEKDGTIRITTQQITADRVQVDIRDDGPGMPQEILQNIFEPFFSTKLGEGHGTGLGLSITYGLVKKLGGEIYVESDVGLGTTFSLVFPIDQQQKGVNGNG